MLEYPGFHLTAGYFLLHYHENGCQIKSKFHLILSAVTKQEGRGVNRVPPA